MFLTEKKSPFPSFAPFRSAVKRPPPPHDFDLIFRTFDETLACRLKTLAVSSDSPSISLNWLSLAVDLLSATHSDAQSVISAMTSASGSSGNTQSFYLDHSVKLLDVCNSISAEIEKMRHRRLLMKFVVHLLESSGDGDVPTPESLRKASENIVDWGRNSRSLVKRRGVQVHEPDVLIRDLVTAVVSICPPRGKISTVERAVLRTIYAVGAITVFVAGVTLSALYGFPEISKIRVSSEFPWSDSVNDLQTTIFNAEKGVVLSEIDDVAASGVALRELIDGGVTAVGGEEQLKNAVKEIKVSTENMSKGLDRLDDGVNKMFSVILNTRNGVLDNYRVGSEKQLKVKGKM